LYYSAFHHGSKIHEFKQLKRKKGLFWLRFQRLQSMVPWPHHFRLEARQNIKVAEACMEEAVHLMAARK
jgi:hypothetical protein